MKYPFVKQEGLKDCAVASLSMIIRYYKGYVAHEQLRDMLGTDKKGTSAYSIIKAAEYIGFKAEGVKVSNLDNLKLPCIAYVTINKQITHYVVIYKIDLKNQELVIADPASRVKKMKIEDFNKITNNIYIMFYQIKKLPYLKSYSILKFVSAFFKNNKNSLVKIAIMSFFANLFITILSFEFKLMIESINYDTKLKYVFFLIFLFIVIVKIITTYLRNLLNIYLDKKINYELTIECYKNIIHFPYIYYCNRTTGEIVSRMNDLEMVKSFISKILITIFADLPLVIMALVIMLNISLKLTVFATLVLLFDLLIIKIFNHSIKDQVRTIQEKRSETTSFLVESLSAYECVKGLNLEEKIIQKFKNKHFNYVNKVSNFMKSYNFQLLLKDIVFDLGNLILIMIGIIEIEKNVLVLSTFITFTYLLSNYLNPIKNLLDTNIEMSECLNALKRVLELNYKVENNGKIKSIRDCGIKIKDLNYSYQDEMIIKNMNLEISKGEKVIILGESGSGKSTLLKIIKRYLKIKSGAIYIDDIDINNYDNNAIYENIAYISQNEMLFTDTLYENLKMDRQVSGHKIDEIAKMCFVDEIVQKKELGYQTLIEENGFNLSGGEKQRVVLARTILNDNKIILIDEGTNQIDISLERKIFKNLFSAFSSKTIIVVSHRVDNVDLFDHVIRLKKGVIIDNVYNRK